MNIPNMLSIFRLILVPIFTYMIIAKGAFIPAGIILVISGVTDYCDGFIARKFNMITNLGKILDPLADKLTQLMTVICLAITVYPIMWFFAIFLFLKDLLLLIGGLMLYQKLKGMVSSGIYGKFATLVFYIAITALILFDGYFEANPIVRSAVIICMVLSCIVALVAYVFQFFSIRSKKFS